MSDGPHRTLPMRRHWRELAERAAKAAFSPEEVCEALPHALKRDFLGEARVLEALRGVLGGGDQAGLFQDERARELEALRRVNPGSTVANTLIDCALEAAASGQSGEDAVRSTIANALDEHTRATFRAVEEHYQRDGSAHSAAYVRGRLDDARRRGDFQSLAGEIATPGQRPERNLPKRGDVDDGPEL